MRRTKVQIKPSVSIDVERYLREEAIRLKKPYGLLVNEALEQYFDLESARSREAILLKRLDQIDRKTEQVQTNLAIVSEAFAIFMKTYLARLPSIPKEQAAASILQADKLFSQFLQEVYQASTANHSLFKLTPTAEVLTHEQAVELMAALESNHAT